MKKRIIQDDIIQDIIYKYEVLRESRHKISIEYKMSDSLIIRILKDNNINLDLRKRNSFKIKRDDRGRFIKK